MAEYLAKAIPLERQIIERKIVDLKRELEAIQKFERDFREEMYAGVEAEDREKMANYVNFFAEFKSVIANESAQL